MPHLSPTPHKLITSLITSSRSHLSSTSLPFSPSALQLSSVLLRHGLLSTLTLGSPSGPNPTFFHAPTTPIPAKRLWIGLKYRSGLPVLRKLSLVSKGSQRVLVNHQELGRLLTGRRAKNVAGVGMGEILVIKEEDGLGKAGGYEEGWECWRRGKGGEVVCRAG